MKFILAALLACHALLAQAQLKSAVPYGFIKCADEGGVCETDGNITDMVFGAGGAWTAQKAFMVPTPCTWAAFDAGSAEPSPGQPRECFRRYTANSGRMPELGAPMGASDIVQVSSPAFPERCQPLSRGGTGPNVFTATQYMGGALIAASCSTPYGWVGWVRVVFAEYKGAAPTSWPADPVIDPPPPVPPAWVVANNPSSTSIPPTRPAFAFVNGVRSLSSTSRALVGAPCDCGAAKAIEGSSTYCQVAPATVAICTKSP